MNAVRNIKFLRRLFVALAVVVTVFALFTAVENRRGRTAWAAEQARLTAKGISLDVNSYIPLPLPRDQNLMAAPLFQEIGTKDLPDTALGRRIKVFKEASFYSDGVLDDELHFYTYAKSSPNRKIFLDDHAIIATFAPIEGDIQSLRSLAMTAKGSQFFARNPKTSVDVRQVMFPDFDLSRIYNFGQKLGARAAAELDGGQNAPAFADCRILMRMIDALRVGPTMLNRLIADALNKFSTAVFRRGCKLHAWNEEQLAFFQDDFSRIDPAQELVEGLNCERAVVTARVGAFEHYAELSPPVKSWLHEGLSNWFWAVRPLIPNGWIEENRCQGSG